jgi:signal transduction histidine kinase/DNA-binding LacI/PurR family transcriptional regulator/FixJ family two-component response regulator
MQRKPSAIGIFTQDMGGYYFGAMISGIHQVTRDAGVPLLIIQSRLDDLRLPAFGAEHVAGWIILHPEPADNANLAVLVASGVPVVTVATTSEDVACSSVVADNCRDTRALVHHLIDHGHRQIAYIDHGEDSWSRERYQGYVDALHTRGIALDPALILDTERVPIEDGARPPFFLRRDGEVAAHTLIARGMPCTALVAGTDHSAIAAMRVLQAAGYRIPEDIAVVGFDDIAEAQYAQPPLTTVRTRFDQLGRTAAEYLLSVLRAEWDGQPTRIFAPTSLLCRRSCGCAGLEEIRSRGADAVAAATNWQTILAEQLVQVVAYPLAPEPGMAPAEIWPGVDTLIAAVDTVLQGQDSTIFAAGIELAWQQAVAITENQELLNAAVMLLEDVAEQRVAVAPAVARPVVTALFRQSRMAMMRARLAYEAAKNQYLTTSGITNQEISQTLLSSQVGASETLAWLGQTPASWGCLGLWADAQTHTSATLTVAGVYQRDSAPLISIGNRYHTTVFPPFEALPLPAQQGQDLTILCPLRDGADELGVLALCGFADQNFIFDTGTLWAQAALLGATLKRDGLVRHLEAQAIVLAQARDAAEAANAAKSAFLANMSHELRTPLNGILGYAQILTRAADLSPQQAQGLQIIQQSGEHLLTLINDILDLAKIEAGKLELMPNSVHFPTFLDGIIGIIRARAEAKHVLFRFEPVTGLPSVIRADETRLRQVLLNVLGNAVKFTQRGRVALQVSVVSGETPAPTTTATPAEPSILDDRLPSTVMIRFEVIDTGVGIHPDDLPKLFRPFGQIGDPRQYKEGTGLGLTISQQLLQHMGCSLQVESQLGGGSTFWFDLTVPIIADDGIEAPTSDRPIVGYAGPRHTILVADDSATNRSFLVDLLTPLGFTVLEATDGPTALAHAQAQRPNLILLDLLMPGLSGIEITRAIRCQPDLCSMAIIATSASVFDADRQQSLLAGCDAFLPKPIAWPRLAPLLERYLELDWVYADEAEVAQVPAALIPPSQEELAALGELVAIGDILALQERAAQLEQRDPQWRAFARELARLAGQFELERLRALLNEYLPTEA